MEEGKIFAGLRVDCYDSSKGQENNLEFEFKLQLLNQMIEEGIVTIVKTNPRKDLLRFEAEIRYKTK